MKPVKLVIEGIKSYTDAQELDFEAVGRNNLFCISGKTGAGKSTIFDSILFALYGRTDKVDLAEMVNLSRTVGKVRFDFTEQGDTYSVERTIKCRYEKDAEGKRTERRTADGECTLIKNGAPIAKGKEATAALRGIIGLEENEFKNVYLLEQGEYAAFLKKTPGLQNEAVGKIFSLMRFAAINKTAKEYKSREEELANIAERRLADFGDDSPETLAEQKKSLTALKARNTALKKEAEGRREVIAALEKQRDVYISAREKQKNVKRLAIDLENARVMHEQAAAALESFEQTSDKDSEKQLAQKREELNGLSALNSLDREYARAQAAAQAAETAYAKKAAAAKEAQSRYAELLGQTERDALEHTQAVELFTLKASAEQHKSAALEAALAAVPGGAAEAVFALAAEKREYVERSAAISKQAAIESEKKASCARILEIISRFTAELSELDKAIAEAADRAQAAEKAYADAQLFSHALSVRAGLKDGDICPVCGGAYHGGGELDSDVEKARAARDAAAAQQKSLEQKHADHAKRTDRAKTDYDREDKELRAAQVERERLCALQDKSNYDPVRYAEYERLLSDIKLKGERASASEQRRAKAEPQIAALAAETEAALSIKTASAQKAEELAAALGDKRGKTDSAIAEVKTVIAALEQKIAAVESERKRLVAAVAAASAAADALYKSLEQARRECPVDLPPFDEQDYADKRAGYDALAKAIGENEKEIAIGEERVRRLTESCEKLKAIAAEKKLYRERADVYGVIADITKNKAMLNYVATEYIVEFTSVASDILADMSGGKYTLSYDPADGFMISDYLNGGKTRKTETLSGGELFLASLAVAIAIARTQSNGNNAFFFLDEGFGTLDGELIDVVYAALESLSRDCLVGFITHSSALIDRMPACVEIFEATDIKGSVIKY